MKVLVTGDRNWTDEDFIRDSLTTLDVIESSKVVLIEGEARGADKISAKIARELGWQVIPVPANWEKYGKAAGPIRNQEMLNMDPDLVIAFHDDLKNSKGTKDMVNRAQKKGVKVTLISSKK